MSKQISVLVSGATGKQGGALARKLLEHKHAVYALTRKPDSQAAHELEKIGVRLVSGDFGDPESIVRAARGIDTFFIMSTSFEKGADAETMQGIAAAEAAKTAGVKHIVYTSVASADMSTGIPHFDSKYKVESALESIGVPYSIIAPAYFFENLISQMTVPGLKKGTLLFSLPPDKKMQMVAVENIGAFAAYVIENKDMFMGTRTELASDELSGPEIAEIMSKLSGKQISFVQQSVDEIRKFSLDFAKMSEWMIEYGYTVDIPGLRVKYPDIGWLHFDEWAKKQNWEIIVR